MAVSTYSQLQTEVGEWLQRSDLSGRIPTFIELATADFNSVLRVPQMEVLASTTVTGEWTALPDNFLGIRHIETSDGERLEYKTPEDFAAYAESQAAPELPVYTIADMSFRMYPTPTSLAVELLYYEMISDLVSAGDTNWLLTQYPSAYLAASLAWGFDYLHDDMRAANWRAKTQQHIALIQRSGRKIAEGASTMAIRAH